MHALSLCSRDSMPVRSVRVKARARPKFVGSAVEERPGGARSSPPDWNESLRAVAGQDRAAFAELFRHFAPRVKSYMLRLGSDQNRAEDIAQDVFAQVWRKAVQFDPAKAAASTWIFTIARNLRIDTFRKENRPELDPNDPALVPDPPVRADVVVEQTQSAQRIRLALAELPDEQKQVVHMSFFEDKTHAEISAALEIPLGTVKSRIRLAFGRIRTELDDERRELNQ